MVYLKEGQVGGAKGMSGNGTKRTRLLTGPTSAFDPSELHLASRRAHRRHLESLKN